LLKVHQSNFRIVGFAQALSIEELAALGKERGIPVMFDLGSGCLIDFRPYGIHLEPTVQEVVKSGADIVTFSGDKLLGGPQGGVIVGKKELIERISRNPLMRAVRVDKMTLAAFEATLMLYHDEEKARQGILTLNMLFQDPERIKAKAKKIALLLRKRLSSSQREAVQVTVAQDASQSGGGALAEVEFKTYVVSIRLSHLPVNAVEERLRHNRPPIIARIKEGALMLDARTVQNSEISELVSGVISALG
jgi:L-seryl-tRNA(Ser) seleniumtransferase